MGHASIVGMGKHDYYTTEGDAEASDADVADESKQPALQSLMSKLKNDPSIIVVIFGWITIVVIVTMFIGSALTVHNIGTLLTIWSIALFLSILLLTTIPYLDRRG